MFLRRDSRVEEKQAFQNLSLIKEPYDENDFIATREQLTFPCARTCKQVAMMLLAMSEKAPVLFMIKVLQKKAAATNCFSGDPADPTAFHTIPVHPPTHRGHFCILQMCNAIFILIVP